VTPSDNDVNDCPESQLSKFRAV